MFSLVCICVHKGILHVTITNDALDLSVQAPAPALSPFPPVRILLECYLD